MRRAVRLLLYASPALLGCVLTLVGATSLGSYRMSWNLQGWLLDTIAPGYAPISDYGVSRYQLNDAFRKLAHVALYTLATVLAVRAARWGRSTLRASAILAALALAALLMGVETLVRLRSADRHVRPVQYLWNLGGVALGIGGVVGVAGLRRMERWAATEEAGEAPPKEGA